MQVCTPFYACHEMRLSHSLNTFMRTGVIAYWATKPTDSINMEQLNRIESRIDTRRLQKLGANSHRRTVSHTSICLLFPGHWLYTAWTTLTAVQRALEGIGIYSKSYQEAMS